MQVLMYLPERLCRTAVPDAGSRLEDLLIRLRRPLGMPMSQWSNEVMEAYRKVQRALIRARQSQQGPGSQGAKTISESQREPPPSPTSPQSSTRTSPTSPAAAKGATRSPSRRTAPMDAVQESGDERGDYQAVAAEEPEDEGGEEPEYYEERWTHEQWKDWRKKQWKEWCDDTSSGEDLLWDELQNEEIQVLPDEVLGWLLLRRANLSASSRLSVQALVNNSLMFRDIEVALRDQEEELLQADQGRGQHQAHKRRSFWVEEEGNWGLPAVSSDDIDENAEIHWVGTKLPEDVYDPGPTQEDANQEDEIYWHWEPDGYHGYVADSELHVVDLDHFPKFRSLLQSDSSFRGRHC